MEEYWEKRGRRRPAPRRALPAQAGAGRRRGGRGRRDQVPEERHTTEADGGTPILVAGEECGPDAGLRMPRGHLPHLHRDADVGQGSRPAKRKRLRHRGRVHPRVHQRAGGPRRSRPLERRSNHLSTTEIESPLAKLSPEQIEQLGKEFDAIHDEVYDGPRRPRPRLHHEHDRDAPADRRVRPRDAARLALQAGLDRRHHGSLRGQDPGEHGDRPQRDARPVGLDERPQDPLVDVGLGHGLHQGGVEALPQLHPPHLHEHPRQGQGPRLRDHADRPAPEVAPGLPLPAGLQRAADAAVRVGRRRPRHGHRGRARRREAAEGGPARTSRASPARPGCRSRRTTSPGRCSAGWR